MGYDYSVGTTDCYLSYNHSWAFYKYVDKGFRSLYDIPLADVVDKLQDMLRQMRGRYGSRCFENFTQDEYYSDDFIEWNRNKDMIGEVETIDGNIVRNDGWAKTVGNAYYFAGKLLMLCQQKIIDGDTGVTINGD